jgi:hypothetical protein
MVGLAKNPKGFDDGVASDIVNGGVGKFRNIGIWFGVIKNINVFISTCSRDGGLLVAYMLNSGG